MLCVRFAERDYIQILFTCGIAVFDRVWVVEVRGAGTVCHMGGPWLAVHVAGVVLFTRVTLPPCGFPPTRE